MIFAVFDVLLAVNMCINYSFFTFIIIIIIKLMTGFVQIVMSKLSQHRDCGKYPP